MARRLTNCVQLASVLKCLSTAAQMTLKSEAILQLIQTNLTSKTQIFKSKLGPLKEVVRVSKSLLDVHLNVVGVRIEFHRFISIEASFR